MSLNASAAQISPVSPHQKNVAQRGHWAKVRERACLYFNASLMVAVYERGLVLEEQMTEC